MADERSTYLTPALLRWRRWTDAPLMVLAIGTLPLLLLEIDRPELVYADRIFLDVVNVAVLVAFAVDYAVELWLAGDRVAYARHEWTSLLIVVAQAAALLPALAPLGAVRFLRVARSWRAFAVAARIIAIGGAASRDGRELLRRHAAGFALAVAGLTWITAAVGFTLAEDVGVNGRIHSFFDAIWWSAATITTVGYGDIYPVTVTGRVIGMATMVVGISTFAILTAKVAQFLVRIDSEHKSTDPD